MLQEQGISRASVDVCEIPSWLEGETGGTHWINSLLL